MTRHRLQDELDWDDVGGRLLANIARGIYTHEAVLREYVQNAADSYRRLQGAPETKSITISRNKNDLTIVDTGVGMNEKSIREAKKIAVSTKAEFEEMVGFRGIGIWAGLTACEKLIVDSTMQGDRRRYWLTIDFATILKHIDTNINIKKLIDPNYVIEYEDANVSEHFTRVTLKNITSDYRKLLEEEELIRIASQILPARIDPKFHHHAKLQKIFDSWPSYQEVPIIVRTGAGLQEVFRQFPLEVEDPQDMVLKSDSGEELARGWYCRTKDTMLKDTGHAIRGFRLRVKNFAVGPQNIYSDEKGHTFGITDESVLILRTATRLNWFCGELHVTHPLMLPNTPRNDLEHDQTAREFIEKVRKFYRERIGEAGAYSDFNPIRNALDEGEALVQKYHASRTKADSKDAQKAKEHIDRLEKTVDQCKGSSTDDAKSLFKGLLRQRGFKNRRDSLIPKLQAILPGEPAVQPRSTTQKGGRSTGAKANGGERDVGAADTTKAPASSGASKQNGSDAAPKNTKEAGAATATDHIGEISVETNPIYIEDILSEIFEILDRRIGDDSEDLIAIKEEIQELFNSRFNLNAAE